MLEVSRWSIWSSWFILITILRAVANFVPSHKTLRRFDFTVYLPFRKLLYADLRKRKKEREREMRGVHCGSCRLPGGRFSQRTKTKAFRESSSE
jgi:hypothetical protein